MKKKIAYFSFACGIILFILTFTCQVFFKIYSKASNLNELYVLEAIFLITYLITFYFFLAKYKKINKMILYIVIPLVLGCVLDMSSSMYYYIRYGSKILIGVPDFFFFYLASGFWSVGVFSGLIDLFLSYILRKKSLQQF